MVNQKRRWQLLFSDITFGHPDLCWIKRQHGEEADDEDLRLEREVMKSKGIKIRVQDGWAYER